VAELNYGKREWKGLHEPASEDATDVALMEALRCAALEISRLTRELEAARERERVNRLAAIVALSSAESVISWAIKHYVRFGRMDNTLGQVRAALRILGKPPVDSHTVALLMEEPSWSFGEAVRRALATDTEVSDGE